MKLFLMFLIALYFPKAQASGCGSYERVFNIVETRPAGTFEGGYDVIAQGNSFLQIRLKGPSPQILTLILARVEKRPPKDSDYELLKYDARFEDGHGCGPIYQCVTGQYQVTVRGSYHNEQRVYEWPALSDSDHEYAHVPSRAGSLLPPFIMSAPSGSDLPQCEYGDW